MSRRRNSNRVDVLGRKFIVRKGTSEAGLAGAMYGDDGIIEVATGQSDFATKDSFLHETMHAILFMQGHSLGSSEDPNYETEEKYVRALSTGLIAFLRSNPAVANWLISDPDSAL